MIIEYLNEQKLLIPYIPPIFNNKMQDIDRFTHASCDIKNSPYDLNSYILLADQFPKDEFCIISFGGHGINSHAIQFYCVMNNLQIFIHKNWAGVYSDPQEDRKMFNKMIRCADKITASPAIQILSKRDMVMRIVSTDSFKSYWNILNHSINSDELQKRSTLLILYSAIEYLNMLIEKPFINIENQGCLFLEEDYEDI